MTKVFIHIYRYFRRHRTVCWVSMVVLFIFFGYFATQIHLEEDINQLMPSSKNPDGSTKLAFANLKIKDKTFLLFTGGEVEDLTDACDEFVDSLMARDSVSNSIGDIFYCLPEELMSDGVDYLIEHFPAYIDTSAYAAFDTLLTHKHFAQQMPKNYDDIMGEFGSMYPELIQMDPMGMRGVLAEQLLPLVKNGAGSYKTIDNHFFVPDSSVCVAFITPRYSATNTGQGSTMFDMLNDLIYQFATTDSDVQISYHGTPASGFYNSTQIKRDLSTTIAGALLLVLLLLLICFRRWSVIPQLLLPVVFGALFSLAMMYWLKSALIGDANGTASFSLLALGIGGVVLGVALSYALHIVTHQQYVNDPEQMLREQVKPILLGCLTTIGSFSALIFIQTELLRDFGLFAAFAILGTTLFSLTYLPQMLDGGQKRQPLPAFITRLSTLTFDSNKPLIATILILTVVCIGAYVVGGTHFDADMHNLGYDYPMVKESEDLLRDKTYTGDKTKYFASEGKTMEEAISHFSVLDQKLDSLERLGLVKGYTHTDKLFVPLSLQQERIDAWRHYWTPERLGTARRLIAETANRANLRAESFAPFFDAATADYEPDAIYDAELIPQGYLSTMKEQSNDSTFLCFTAVRCQNDSVRSNESDYIRICDDIAQDPHLLVLDTYYYTTDTLLAMSRDFDRLQWFSMGFVLLVLLVSFRFNLKHTLLAFMPILLSWLIVLGAMNIFGQQFNLISIIISTFIFGIGVDYSIFIMQGLISDKREKDNTQLSVLNCHKTAILLSAAILFITVGSMLIAVHPAIRSVGFSTLVGLLSAVVLSYVLQPAVYRWTNRKSK